MIKYVGNSPKFTTGLESEQYEKRKRRTIALNKKFIKDMKHRCDYKIRCTYDEYCWMKNLLYYRREKLGIKCRVHPMEGTAESLLDLIQMKPVRYVNMKERTAYNDNKKNDNWDIMDEADLV